MLAMLTSLSNIDLTAISLGAITAVGVFLNGIGTIMQYVKTKEIHNAVQTENGETVGQRIDTMADLANAIEDKRVADLPWDGTERRVK